MIPYGMGLHQTQSENACLHRISPDRSGEFLLCWKAIDAFRHGKFLLCWKAIDAFRHSTAW